jgi:hypothetical protein
VALDRYGGQARSRLEEWPHPGVDRAIVGEREDPDHAIGPIAGHDQR